MAQNIFATLILVICVLGTVAIDKSVKVSIVMGFLWIFLLTIAQAYYSIEQLPPGGISYIVASCIIFLIANVVSGNISIINRVNTEVLSNPTRIINNVNTLAFFAIAGHVFILASAIYNGVSIAGIGAIAGSTYHAEIEGTLFGKIVNAFCFSFISLDGFAFFYQKNREYRGCSSKKKYKTYIIVLLALQLMIATVSSQKSPIIWSAIFWITGILTGVETFISREEQRSIIGRFIKDNLIIITMLIVGFVSALLFLFFVRHRESLSAIIDYFMIYGFCEVPVFAIWFENITADALQHSMGGQTFFGIIRLIGMGENLSINWPLDNNALLIGVHSNIFTAFRGLIEDFGVKDSLWFWCTLGIITGQAERETNKSIIKIGLVNMIIVFVLFTFLISAWHYATVFIACIMFFLELIYVKCVCNDYCQSIIDDN